MGARKLRRNALPETMLEFAEDHQTEVDWVDRYGYGGVDLDRDSSIPYRYLEPVSGWANVEEDPGSFVFVSPYLTYGDYSGGSVERANVQVFEEQFGEEPGVYTLYGSHGSTGIAVRLTVDNPEIIETFAALEDYPAIDDEAVSEIEREAAEEQLDSWALRDFANELRKRHEKLTGEEIEHIGIDSDKSVEALTNLFWHLEGECGEYAYMEEGGGMVYPLRRMLDQYKPGMLDEFKIEYAVEED